MTYQLQTHQLMISNYLVYLANLPHLAKQPTFRHNSNVGIHGDQQTAESTTKFYPMNYLLSVLQKLLVLSNFPKENTKSDALLQWNSLTQKKLYGPLFRRQEKIKLATQQIRVAQ